jgi:RNA polymerase sigma-70 factor (ECF subfamily)
MAGMGQSAESAMTTVDFEDAIQPLSGPLYRRALSLTRNGADAEDLVQETLLKAYRSFHTLGEDPRLLAWLTCIMRNAWINSHRASSRRPTEELSGDVDDLEGGRGAPSAEHVALHGVPSPALASALSALPESMRQTMYYFAVEGLSCREVATVMGVPPGTVMSRLHRSRRHLRDALHGALPCPDR